MEGRWATSIAVTFHLIILSLVFFRAASVHEAFVDIAKIVHVTSAQLHAALTGPQTTGYIDASVRLALSSTYLGLFMIAMLIGIEYMQGRLGKPIEALLQPCSRLVRWPAYAAVIAALLVFGAFISNDFIYAHF